MPIQLTRAYPSILDCIFKFYLVIIIIILLNIVYQN